MIGRNGSVLIVEVFQGQIPVGGGKFTPIPIRSKLQSYAGHLVRCLKVISDIKLTNSAGAAKTLITPELLCNLVQRAQWYPRRTVRSQKNDVRGCDLAIAEIALGYQTAFGETQYQHPRYTGSTQIPASSNYTLRHSHVIPMAAPTRGEFANDTAPAVGDVTDLLELTFAGQDPAADFGDAAIGMGLSNFRVIAELVLPGPGVQCSSVLAFNRTQITSTGLNQSLPSGKRLLTYLHWSDYDGDTPPGADDEVEVSFDAVAGASDISALDDFVRMAYEQRPVLPADFIQWVQVASDPVDAVPLATLGRDNKLANVVTSPLTYELQTFSTHSVVDMFIPAQAPDTDMQTQAEKAMREILAAEGRQIAADEILAVAPQGEDPPSGQAGGLGATVPYVGYTASDLVRVEGNLAGWKAKSRRFAERVAQINARQAKGA